LRAINMLRIFNSKCRELLEVDRILFNRQNYRITELFLIDRITGFFRTKIILWEGYRLLLRGCPRGLIIRMANAGRW
jgi:hypothetical protein